MKTVAVRWLAALGLKVAVIANSRSGDRWGRKNPCTMAWG
jgi:hypothetical protein